MLNSKRAIYVIMGKATVTNRLNAADGGTLALLRQETIGMVCYKGRGLLSCMSSSECF